LDGITCPDIFDKDKAFLEQFKSCVQMSFNSSQLKVLRNFPYMEKLVKLELQDNKIRNGLEYIGNQCPNLEILKLTNNYIVSIEEVKKLSVLKGVLYQLELLGNPICEMNMYTNKVFRALPGLGVLDGQDREGNEVCTDEEDVNEDYDLDDYGDE
jgi:Ran GTPase-activating protein (RanGAP) involved in mRNA processing and transport